jgi:hypothetical protein
MKSSDELALPHNGLLEGHTNDFPEQRQLPAGCHSWRMLEVSFGFHPPVGSCRILWAAYVPVSCRNSRRGLNRHLPGKTHRPTSPLQHQLFLFGCLTLSQKQQLQNFAELYIVYLSYSQKKHRSQHLQIGTSPHILAPARPRVMDLLDPLFFPVVEAPPAIT